MLRRKSLQIPTYLIPVNCEARSFTTKPNEFHLERFDITFVANFKTLFNWLKCKISWYWIYYNSHFILNFFGKLFSVSACVITFFQLCFWPIHQPAWTVHWTHWRWQLRGITGGYILISMLEIEITHIIDTFKLIKTILNQNICIIDNIIEQTQLLRKDNFKGIRHNIYTYCVKLKIFCCISFTIHLQKLSLRNK